MSGGDGGEQHVEGNGGTSNGIFSRLDGLLDTRRYGGASVTIIGLGSGGSRIALELACAGVPAFDLIDFDTLEPANVIRHVAGLRDVGRLKVDAVADEIRNRNPDAAVRTHALDAAQNEGMLRECLDRAALLVVASDSLNSKRLANRLACEARVPAVYGACFERAFGGHVFRVLPGETPCFEEIQRIFQFATDLEFTQRHVDYSRVNSERDLQAEPGLGLDIGFIALLMAKMALLTLLRTRDIPTTLPDFPGHYLLFGNQADPPDCVRDGEPLFDGHLCYSFLSPDRDEDCPVCSAAPKSP